MRLGILRGCDVFYPDHPVSSFSHSPSVFERPPPLLERHDLVPREVLDALVELLDGEHGERVVGDYGRLGRVGERRVQLA